MDGLRSAPHYEIYLDLTFSLPSESPGRTFVHVLEQEELLDRSAELLGIRRLLALNDRQHVARGKVHGMSSASAKRALPAASDIDPRTDSGLIYTDDVERNLFPAAPPFSNPVIFSQGWESLKTKKALAAGFGFRLGSGSSLCLFGVPVCLDSLNIAV